MGLNERKFPTKDVHLRKCDVANANAMLFMVHTKGD